LARREISLHRKILSRSIDLGDGSSGAVTFVSWDQQFSIQSHCRAGKSLVTLCDAAERITQLPDAEHGLLHG
jgi:hypothetical protein